MTFLFLISNNLLAPSVTKNFSNFVRAGTALYFYLSQPDWYKELTDMDIHRWKAFIYLGHLSCLPSSAELFWVKYYLVYQSVTEALLLCLVT